MPSRQKWAMLVVVAALASVPLAKTLSRPMPREQALVHKSADDRGAAAIAAFQAVRCDTGMPSRVIRLSTEQAALASVFWAGRVRARRSRPMIAL